MLIVSVSCKFVKSSAIQERILMPEFFFKEKKRNNGRRAGGDKSFTENNIDRSK